MIDNITTFSITIPSIEIAPFTQYADFNAQSLPTVARAASNAANFIRYRQVMRVLSDFQTSMYPIGTSLGDTYSIADTSVFPVVVPSTVTLTFTFRNLSQLINLYSSSMGTISSTASTSVYTASQISNAGAVLKSIISTALTTGSITEKQAIVIQQSELTYPLNTALQITNSANISEVIYTDVSAPALVSPTITVIAS
jgi:hypothetical protein